MFGRFHFSSNEITGEESWVDSVNNTKYRRGRAATQISTVPLRCDKSGDASDDEEREGREKREKKRARKRESGRTRMRKTRKATCAYTDTPARQVRVPKRVGER